VLPACLRIGRESARCLQLPEPRPPWYSSCPKRKLEGFRKPEAPTGNLDPLDSELNFRRHPSAWRLWAARLERRHATERASGPTTATALPIVAEPRVPQVRFPQVQFPQLKPFSDAGGDVDWFCASYRTLSPCKIYHDLARIRMQCCFARAGLGNSVTTWIRSRVSAATPMPGGYGLRALNVGELPGGRVDPPLRPLPLPRCQSVAPHRLSRPSRGPGLQYLGLSCWLGVTHWW
jgi:hypothetical protein